MVRVRQDAELLALERIVAADTRPPPGVVVGKDHEAYAAVGCTYVEAKVILASQGYRVSRTRSDLHGCTVPPYSAKVQTVPDGCRRTIAAVAVCRPLTEVESQLVEAYHWLPGKIISRRFPAVGATWRDEMLSSEGQPYLCYAAMRYDGRCRFGTYAEAVIFERYLRRWTDLRDYNEQVKSLDGLQDVVGDFVEDRPETASTTSEALEDVFRMHAPYATRRERDVLIAYLGLDGDRRQKLREIGARLQLCNERIRQIAETALNNARAYKRGAAGRRLGNQS